ncbi:MAG TPA: rhomboid family intramembrane serine protease [Anaeromyxobacteraceae bacterium]|nr:rhomboid family intramembrane serine protease [Anaeromyxobacteraceae bacterium]
MPPTLRQRIEDGPASYALIGLFIVAFLATSLDPEQRLFALFAKVNERVLAGEVWRLVTASFLHGGLAHLAFNSMALASVGPSIERLYGRPRFLLVFLGGGAVGMAASVAFVPNPSVGASAGIFALFGALLGFAVRARRRLTPQARRLILQDVGWVVALNVGLGFMSGYIDNAAHLGGLAAGVALGLALRERPSPALRQG